MKIVLGSDHAGFDYKIKLAKYLEDRGYTTTTVGAPSEEPYDYPDAADEVAQKILLEGYEKGVLICGSGVGVCIRANRYKKIIASNVQTPELAQLSKEHDHINVLCLGQRLMSLETAIKILEAFLNTTEDNHERHVRRVGKLDQPLITE